MRGKRGSQSPLSAAVRITPARAGKTARRPRSRPQSADHPRACGENPGEKLLFHDFSGSPPRVRGKPVQSFGLLDDVGITPARAGKTPCASKSTPGPRDHPRACGENLPPSREPYRDSGSPPRVRGKPDLAAVDGLRVGITPARAGKTCGSSIANIGDWDHPRACGENCMDETRYASNYGSPPRVRGKPGVQLVAQAFPGITPARAGKTGQKCSTTTPWRDHPRACGENKIKSAPMQLAEGSPPRVRGKPDVAGLWRRI